MDETEGTPNDAGDSQEMDLSDLPEDGGVETPPDGSAGAPGASGAGATPPGGAAGDDQPRFTQRQLNQIVQQRLQEDRERAARRAAPPARPGGRETPRPDPLSAFDAPTQQALRALLASEMAPLREAAVKSDIDRSIANFAVSHPDFSKKEVHDAVIGIITSWDERLVNSAPMDWLLQQGWLAYKFGNFDEKSFRQTVEREYVDRKAKEARETPTVQGSGGKATTGSKKGQPGKWSDTDAAMRALIDEENAART